jgi:hypothetical protein
VWRFNRLTWRGSVPGQEGGVHMSSEDPYPDPSSLGAPSGGNKKGLRILVGVVVLAVFLLIVYLLIYSPPLSPAPTPSPEITLPLATETPKPTSWTPESPYASFTPFPLPSLPSTVTPTETATPTPSPSIEVTPPAPVPFEVYTVIIGKSGAFNSMAFDWDNNPVIAYLKLNAKQGPNDQDQLMITRLEEGYWKTAALTDGTSIEGFFNSLKADSGGNLYLAYYSYTNNKIIYRALTSGSSSWTSPQVVAEAFRKQGNTRDRPRPSIVVDANQKPHIVFLEISSSTLFYLDGSKNWQKQEIASNIDSTGYSFPVVMDKNNQVVVAYYDMLKGLVIARLQNGTWTADSEPVKFSSGLFPALAADSAGNLYLSYFDSQTNSLNLAVYDGIRWSAPVTIDENGGKYSSLAVGNDGLVHIVYIGDLNASTCSLKYAIGSGLSFSKPEIVYSSLPAKDDKYLSLALDGAGKPWISFYDPTGDAALKVAVQQ